MKHPAIQASPFRASEEKYRIPAHSAVRVLPARQYQADTHQRATPNGFTHDFSRIPAILSHHAQTCRQPGCTLSPARCPFGGACHNCPLPVQTKPTINRPGDKYEQEAERVADWVMHSPEPILTAAGNGETSGILQRACSVCKDEAAHRDDDDSENIDLLFRASDMVAPQSPSNQSAEFQNCALADAGRPLPGSLLDFFEPRFGCNLNSVRLHTGAQANKMAKAVRAHAFTSGRSIVFAQGSYAPWTAKGRHMIAHELTHVIQQRNSGRPEIQRRIEVDSPATALPGAPPRQHWQDIRDSIRTMTSDFDVDAAGAVNKTNPAACAAPSRDTERCLCDLDGAAATWKIKIDDNQWPHTVPPPVREVFVQSSRSEIDLGAWATGPPGGQRIFEDQWRVLAHELCGHAWLMERVVHPAFSAHVVGGRLMGRPSHNVTVQEENIIAREVGGPAAPQRGLFADPHSGESFGRVTVSGFGNASSSIAALPAAMRNRIDVIENFMTATPDLKADIIGHSDHTGSAADNASISSDRAQAMRTELHTRGISLSRFNRVAGRGPAECPPVPAANPDCRKVEVFMYIFESASESFP